jgi:hypothetical protein
VVNNVSLVTHLSMLHVACERAMVSNLVVADERAAKVLPIMKKAAAGYAVNRSDATCHQSQISFCRPLN